ncbi:MAG: hypothetical protein DHS20C01_33740 [marine bacterium B5-7]|nr:MAG: hypothetical protein DHS20C01_33740 [marine bacterium B5-7]
MSSSTRLIFVVFDSADQYWLKHWAKAGDLPNFKRLGDASLHGEIENRPGVFTIATWFSLATGVEPTRHGFYSFSQYDPGTYRLTNIEAEKLHYQTLWQALDEQGKKCAVIDFPRMPLLKLQHGLQVIDWYPHDLSANGLASDPENVAIEIQKRYGSDPFEGHCDRFRLKSADDFKEFITIVEKRIQCKVEFAESLWRSSRFDTLTVGFGDAHCAGHQCWHLQHADHLRHDKILAHAVPDPIKQVYRALDTALGRLLDLADENTKIVVLANPGMEANYHSKIQAAELLERINESLPHGDHAVNTMSSQPMPELARKKSLSVPVGDTYFAIRANVIDRERYGILRMGMELDAYLQEITQEIMALHREDGLCVFDDVIRTSDTYHVDHQHNLPDLMFKSRRDLPSRVITSPLVGSATSNFTPHRSGDHNPLGAYWVYPAPNGVLKSDTVRDLDIGVTLCALFDTDIEDCDGNVIDQWLV